MYENTAVYPSAQKPLSDPAPPRVAYAKPVVFERGELQPDVVSLPNIPLTKNPMYVPFEETAAGKASASQLQPSSLAPPLPTTSPSANTTTTSNFKPVAAHYYENSDMQMAPIGNYVNFKDTKPVDHDPAGPGTLAQSSSAIDPHVLRLYSEVRKKPESKPAASSGGSTPIYTMSREDAESCLKGDSISVGTYLFRASKT